MRRLNTRKPVHVGPVDEIMAGSSNLAEDWERVLG